MIKMNKRSELVTIFILLVGLAIIIISYEGYISTRDYVGDESTKVAYNIKSKSPSCNLYAIVINNSNVRLFVDEKEATNANFTISPLCH